MPKTEVYAAPPATHYEITGMTDQDGLNRNEFYNFPGNAIETEETIYIATNQLGQGKVDITLDGISRNFQEVKSTSIIENTYYGRVVAGWNITYKINNLTKGMHIIKFTCSGTNVPSYSK